MSNVVRLVTETRHPQTRACNACRHRPKKINSYTHCQATGNYIWAERSIDGKACGREGNLWEPGPPERPSLRKRILAWMRSSFP